MRCVFFSLHRRHWSRRYSRSTQRRSAIWSRSKKARSKNSYNLKHLRMRIKFFFFFFSFSYWHWHRCIDKSKKNIKHPNIMSVSYASLKSPTRYIIHSSWLAYPRNWKIKCWTALRVLWKRLFKDVDYYFKKIIWPFCYFRVELGGFLPFTSQLIDDSVPPPIDLEL